MARSVLHSYFLIVAFCMANKKLNKKRSKGDGGSGSSSVRDESDALPVANTVQPEEPVEREFVEQEFVEQDPAPPLHPEAGVETARSPEIISVYGDLINEEGGTAMKDGAGPTISVEVEHPIDLEQKPQEVTPVAISSEEGGFMRSFFMCCVTRK